MISQERGEPATIVYYNITFTLDPKCWHWSKGPARGTGRRHGGWKSAADRERPLIQELWTRRCACAGMANSSPFGLTEALERNIEALAERRRAERAQASRQERMADVITRFTGSMAFVYLHLAIVAFWIAVNVGAVPGVARFDETFVILATAASVEAIFLSTFVLISQNRMQADTDRRADLDLHISLLTEHELTKLAGVVREIADRIGIDGHRSEDVREIEQDIDPERVLDEIEAKKG